MRKELYKLFDYLDKLSFWSILIGIAVLINILFLINLYNNYRRNKNEKQTNF